LEVLTVLDTEPIVLDSSRKKRPQGKARAGSSKHKASRAHESVDFRPHASRPATKQRTEARTGMRAQALSQLAKINFNKPIRVSDYDSLLEYLDEELMIRDLNEPYGKGNLKCCSSVTKSW